MTVLVNNSIKVDGEFYHYLNEQNQYDTKTLKCIENTFLKLEIGNTSANKPGMLLGKIQSGKTRTFLGIMGLAYDNGIDIVVILTKGTNALAKQTFARLNYEFTGMIQKDKMRVFDIMTLPDNLRKYELTQKIAIVVKKETKNMDRLYKAFFEDYPHLSEKRILFIDDEADFASVAYQKNKESEIKEMKIIAGKIDNLRKELLRASFLQVTATPYSLYLQPDDLEINEYKVFQPIRPSFTELVPIHDRYVGGEMYFENSEIEGHIASYLYHDVSEKELEIMKKLDRRRIKMDNLLEHENIRNIRQAIMNFIVGSSIRRWQQVKLGEVQQKYACVIHTERGKSAHAWQDTIVQGIEQQLREAALSGASIFIELIEESYKDLMKSVSKLELPQPTFEDILKVAKEALLEEYLLTSIVNSEKDVNELLDDSGQLRLRAPMNIFIGGQILDRGITIGNLIGFFYGRNPKSFQQDTVLQHSRMYGARPIEDVAVTRFYTTQKIYNVMKRIHEFDTELRLAFEKGGHSQGVVFIRRDVNQIVPCSPNKILLSNVTMLKPHKRILPVGFQTGYKANISKTITQISKMIEELKEKSPVVTDDAFLLSIEDAKEILRLVHSTLEMEDGHEWDLEEYHSILDYLSYDIESEYQGFVWTITRVGRNIKRLDSEGRFENSPDTPKGEKGELKIARKVAQRIPALILLKQNGERENGWMGTSFWWPVIVAPSQTSPTVFAKKTIK
ncbi:Z1 domain-containing protein [Priestia megaterium]|uniref:Z1 domain-containing protein n=1 Tax=Priestia megaterium TaxID=1404 RepID=UPI002FFD9FB3